MHCPLWSLKGGGQGLWLSNFAHLPVDLFFGDAPARLCPYDAKRNALLSSFP